MPISMTDKNNNKYYLHYDQVGSLRAVTDSNGNLVKEIVYDSYGNIISDTNPDFKVPFGFAGGLYDSDTKLVHFGYREYDPQIGRWLSKDPLLFGGGDSNLYGYVLQDPVNLVDPSGEFAVPVIVALGIGLGVYLALEPSFEKAGQAAADVYNRASEWLDDLFDDLFEDTEKQPIPNKPETCEEEWARAYQICREMQGSCNVGITGGYNDIEKCAAGLVSERCGGNKVE